MNRKGTKQLIYGSLYLFIIGMIIFGVYALALKPEQSCADKKHNQNETGVDCGGLCQPCELKTLSDIRSFPVRLVEAPNNRTSALIEFQNPNATYGAIPFKYTVLFVGEGEVSIGSVEEETLMYAGEIVFRVLPNLAIPFDSVVKGLVQTPVVNWVASSAAPAPRVSSRAIQLSFEGEEQERVRISFVIKNDNPYVLSAVKVHALAFNEFASLVGASRTLTESLAAFEERAIEMVMPITDFSGNETDLDVKLSFEAER